MNKLVLLAVASLPLSVLAQGGLPDKPYIYVSFPNTASPRFH